MCTNEFIRQLEHELWRRNDAARTTRQFPTLPGTAANACLLPACNSQTDFDLRYGGPSLSEKTNATLRLSPRC